MELHPRRSNSFLTLLLLFSTCPLLPAQMNGEAARDWPVIFRDTLRRDFGEDPDMLREQVTRTVRHELAHHLGWDELGVRDLGL